MGGRTRLTVLLVGLGLAIPAASASAETFTNPTPILDPSSVGPEVPYPLTISVSGLAGTITKARATLIDLDGGPERDLDVLLTGPGGSTLLISDICSLGGTVPDFSHRTLTFDDDAPAAINQTCMADEPASGTFKPTNYDTADSFPGVTGPYPLGLANVRGTSPNGSLNLYVVDDTNPDAVSVNGGWSLELTTTGAAAATPAPTAAATKKCKRKKKRAAEAKKRCKKKKR